LLLRLFEPANAGRRRRSEVAKACAMSRRTEWRERYTDQTSLVKSVQVDLGSFTSIRDYFESLASIGMAKIRKDLVRSVRFEGAIFEGKY
jgi:hypothetical protein